MRQFTPSLLCCLALVVFITGCMTPRHESTATVQQDDFTYGYWLNGWKRQADDQTPPVLAIEAQQYGLTLDLANLDQARFGRLDDGAGFETVAAARDSRLAQLDAAELLVEVDVNGVLYRAKSSELKKAWMWESGRIAQHFDLKRLDLRNADGQQLDCNGQLKLVAWPDSLNLTATLTPTIAFKEGRTANGVSGAGHIIIDMDLIYPHQDAMEAETFTLETWFHEPSQLAEDNRRQWLIGKNENEWEDGCFGFFYSTFEINFVMNIGGGRDNQVTIKSHKSREGDAPGQWKHLVGTYDGDVMRFYVNGKLQGEETIGRKRAKGNGILRIGKRPDGVAHMPHALKGMYDEIRIWNRTLSAEEIQAHHKDPSAIPNRDGLAFEENFGVLPAADKPPAWTDTTFRLALKCKAGSWETETKVDGDWALNEARSVNLHCPIVPGAAQDGEISGTVTYSNGQSFPLEYRTEYGGFVAEVARLKRTFDTGYVKITEYDEFSVVFDYSGETATMVPFLLDLRGPANITGLVPILCHEDGTPTGIPVQLSKNWHYRTLGAYLRAYALIPAQPGANRYLLRIPYGFYGSLPSASHAQLCLVGYGGNQRWDQLALACGGESITFDVDMSLTEVAICDVRVPMGRKGKDGNPWGWTDAGWGGDWLGLVDAQKRKLTFAAMKTAYLSHGPCLSDVRYVGAYGSARDVLVDARVENARSDDYGRTFQQLDYRFQRELAATDSYLMKRHDRAFDRVVAYGNGDGLIAELRIEGGIKKGDLLLPPTLLTGPRPWWVAYPDRDQGPTGYVSMIIRDYKASFGGKLSTNPWLQVKVDERQGDEAKLETLFVPPPDVTTYKTGDYVSFDAELVHLVTEADNYGGPNEAYRKHLVENPRSWKTTYREVKGNDLKIEVDGGKLLQKLPIVIQADKSVVTVIIQGGVGYVPIRFEGLKSATGYTLYQNVDGKLEALDQSVHGNDFWQTDLDLSTGTFKRTYNLPVDGLQTSTWILTRK